MQQLQKITENIRQFAYHLGFDACGFAKAERLDEDARRLEDWLLGGRNGKMAWIENYFDKRVDPRELVPGAKTVVSVFLQYKNQKALDAHKIEGIPKISKYAMGDDYHDVLREKLYHLFEFTREQIGHIEGRVFVDSAPVLDKAWAIKSGLGWRGKNSLVLNKKFGSNFFIGEMIIDAELVYDGLTTDHCGTCTLCMDHCPTGAIYEPHRVDASKCITYMNIELREAIPVEYHEKIGEWMFGCDICQDVCPWNRKNLYSREPRFEPREQLIGKDVDFWEELDIEQYRTLFRKSAVKRAKFEGLKDSISVVANNLKIKS